MNGHFALLFFIIGVVSSMLFNIDLSQYLDIPLILLLFLVGYDIASNVNLKEVKIYTLRATIVVFSTVIGSMIGGLIASTLLNMSLREGVAAALGMGWYTMTAPLLLEKIGSSAAFIGFASNFLREVISLLTYPHLSKVVGATPAIAMAGATSMDTTLPVISKYGGKENTIIALIHGSLVTMLAPILVQIALNIF